MLRKRGLLIGTVLAVLLIAAIGRDDEMNDLRDGHPTEDASDLSRIKSELKNCRKSIMDLEDTNDTYISQLSTSQATIHELQNKIADLAAHEASLIVAKEETNLVRKELSIAHERLDVCLVSLKAHASRENTYRQDLELCAAELRAATAREAEAEKALRQNDCTAVKHDLRIYRNHAEEAEVEKETLKRIVNACEAQIQDLPVLEQRVEEFEAAWVESEAAQKVLSAELEATKRALESLLVSLDARQKYEDLRDAHEKEWLPHWLEECVANGKAAGQSLWEAADQKITPMITTVTATANKLWNTKAKPVLISVDSTLGSIPGWFETRHAVERGILALAERTRTVLGAAAMHVVSAEHSAEQSLIKQMQKVDSLRPFARHSVVHNAVWALAVSLSIPLAFSLLKFVLRTLHYRLRRGTASVQPPVSTTEFTALEEKLGYIFQQGDDALKKAFSAPEKGALEWLGRLLAQLLAVESIVKAQGVDNTTSSIIGVQEDIKTAESTGALAAAADRAGVGQYVLPGPGAKSAAVAAARKAELFAACLGAVFVDAEYDLNAARKVVGGGGDIGGEGDGGTPVAKGE